MGTHSNLNSMVLACHGVSPPPSQRPENLSQLTGMRQAGFLGCSLQYTALNCWCWSSELQVLLLIGEGYVDVCMDQKRTRRRQNSKTDHGGDQQPCSATQIPRMFTDCLIASSWRTPGVFNTGHTAKDKTYQNASCPSKVLSPASFREL